MLCRGCGQRGQRLGGAGQHRVARGTKRRREKRTDTYPDLLLSSYRPVDFPAQRAQHWAHSWRETGRLQPAEEIRTKSARKRGRKGGVEKREKVKWLGEKKRSKEQERERERERKGNGERKEKRGEE